VKLLWRIEKNKDTFNVELVSASVEHLFLKLMEKAYIYIMSNKNRTVLYVGFTSDLKRRILQHRNKRGADFTKRYSVFDLLYFEEFSTKYDARKREHQLKNWHKEWKWNLIKEFNPKLKDLLVNIKDN